MAPGVGIVAVRFDTMGVVTWNYGVNDVIGSPMTVLDGSASPQHEAFDAWGKQRYPGGAANTTCSLTSLLPRGFTGQEAMDSFCMVNMNARVYDPRLGRFLSADTIVPNPMNMQSFNGYSYVGNNPLAYIDPTGHQDIPSENGGPSDPTGGSSRNIFQDFRNLCLYMDGCESYAPGGLPSTLFGGGGGGGVGSSGIFNSLDFPDLFISGTTRITVEEFDDQGNLISTNSSTGSFEFTIPFNSTSTFFSPDVVANIPMVNFTQPVETVVVTAQRRPADKICMTSDGSLHSYVDAGGGLLLISPGGGTFGTSVGAVVNSTAMPTLTKRGGVSGGGLSGPITSRASSAARGLTGNARLGALRPLTGTGSIGGSLGRALPIAGTVLMFLDFMETSKNIPVCTPAT